MNKAYRKTLWPRFLLVWPSSWETPNRCSYLVLSEWLRYGLWSQSTRVDFSAFLSRPLVMSKELDLCVSVLLFHKMFWIISTPQNSNTGDGTGGGWWAFGVWAAMPWCSLPRETLLPLSLPGEHVFIVQCHLLSGTFLALLAGNWMLCLLIPTLL